VTDAPPPDFDPNASPLPPPRIRRLRVLRRVALVLAVVIGLYLVHPWILPAYITEGPLVQQTTPTSATVVWYTSRPVHRGMSIEVNGQATPVQSQGWRHHVTVTGLPPSTRFPYQIKLGSRTLRSAELRTNHAADESFSFIVFGDSGTASSAQYVLAERMTGLDPDFVLHTGDLVYSAGQRHRYRSRFFRPYRDILERVSFWPSLGNHDVGDPNQGQSFRTVFELPQNGPAGLKPENNYWFDYANVRVVVIDSNQDETLLGEKVAPWIVTALADDSPTWRFAVLHHPPYTCGSYKPDAKIQKTLVPAFEQAGVDIVFAGHDHTYQRSKPILAGSVVEPGRGVVYVVTGAGGGKLYEVEPLEQRPDYADVVVGGVFGFTRVSISGRTLSLSQIGVEGEKLDDWTLQKTPAAATAP